MWKAEGDCCHRKSMEFTIPEDKKCEEYDGVKNSKGICVSLICDDLTRPTPCCGMTDCDHMCCNCNCRKLNIAKMLKRGFKTQGVNLLGIHDAESRKSR